MNNEKKASQTRLIVAISLFAAALISAMALSTLSNQSQTYWVARKNLIPGAQISQSDLAQVQVALGESQQIYLGKNSAVVGSFVRYPLSKGELISVNSVSDLPSKLRNQQVPISVRNSDIPLDLEVGESIDLFWVPTPTGIEAPPAPKLILMKAFLISIDRKGANYGSEVSLTISLASEDIFSLLESTISGRLVIVRANG